MKKNIFYTLMVIAGFVFMANCQNVNAQANAHSRQTFSERSSQQTKPTNNAKASGTPYYYVTFEIKQGTFTLDLWEHVKNKVNAMTISIPVDKRYYDSVSVGTTIKNDTKIGSLLVDGDWSKLKVKVIKKEIKYK